MKKTILLIVGLVIIVGGVWYMSSSDTPIEEANTEATEERNEQPATNEQVEENLSGFGSFENILSRGDNVRCEFKSTYEGQTSEGTFVTDGERFRMEATIEDLQSGQITSNVINDGSHTYTWSTSADGTMALKIANTEIETDNTIDYSRSIPPEQAQVGFEQEVEYDCDRWSVDATTFVPPNDIEFTDMEAMMQEAMQGMPEGFEMPEGFPAN